MILDKCITTYLQKYLFWVKQKTNVKVFNIITRINEPKTLIKHISCDCKCKFNSTTCNSNQRWNNEICHCQCFEGAILKMFFLKEQFWKCIFWESNFKNVFLKILKMSLLRKQVWLILKLADDWNDCWLGLAADSDGC